MTDNKIISFNNLLDNKDYQASLSQKTKEIMGNAETMNTDELLSNNKFNSIFTTAEGINIDNVKASVKQIVGNDITQSELNLILALMDANAEMVKMETGRTEEKFVMDSQFEIGEKNGLFEATVEEKQKLQNRSFYFQDKGKPIAEMVGNDIIMKYEDGTMFLKLKWGLIPTKLPALGDLTNFINNLNNKDD